jgi:hypothetical protein
VKCMRVGGFEDATCEGTNLGKSRYQPDVHGSLQRRFFAASKCYELI